MNQWRSTTQRISVLVLVGLLCMLVPHKAISANGPNASKSIPTAHKTTAKSKTVRHVKAHHGEKDLAKRASLKKTHKKYHSQQSKPANREQIGIFTAYTSKAGKRSGSDHKTADGTDLKEAPSCVLANNKMPMGTKISIEGIGTCEVRDRIGKRVKANRFDIHVGDDPKWAKDFGKKKLKYSIEGRGKTAPS